MRPTHTTALFVALVGCDTPEPCPRPEVVGGSPDMAASVRAAIDHFYDALGEGPFCVPVARIEPLEDVGGRYLPRQRHILIADDSPTPASTTFHELCHAWFDQDSPIDPVSSTWDLRRGSDATRSHHYDDYDLELRASESFARTCDVGPAGAWLFHQACPSGRGAEAFDRLRSLFPDVGPPPHVEARFHEVGTWAFGTQIWGLDVRETTDPRVVHVGVGYTSDTRVFQPRTLWFDQEMPPRADALDRPTPPPRLPGVSITSWATAGDDSLLVAKTVAGNGTTIGRLLHHDGTRYATVGCLRPYETVFSVDGVIWSAWSEARVDGDIVHYGFWEIEPR